MVGGEGEEGGVEVGGDCWPAAVAAAMQKRARNKMELRSIMC